MISSAPWSRQARHAHETPASERLRAAVVLAAAGNISKLRRELDLAASDWRRVLVGAGLGDEDWRVEQARAVLA